MDRSFVPFNDIDDGVFQQLLKELDKLPKLKYLDLANSKITDEHLDELGRFKGLRELRLQRCRNLNLEAVQALRQQLPNCEISFQETP